MCDLCLSTEDDSTQKFAHPNTKTEALFVNEFFCYRGIHLRHLIFLEFILFKHTVFTLLNIFLQHNVDLHDYIIHIDNN